MVSLFVVGHVLSIFVSFSARYLQARKEKGGRDVERHCRVSSCPLIVNHVQYIVTVLPDHFLQSISGFCCPFNSTVHLTDCERTQILRRRMFVFALKCNHLPKSDCMRNLDETVRQANVPSFFYATVSFDSLFSGY